MKKIVQYIMLGMLVVLTSCIKDKGFNDNKYGIKDPQASPVGVGFPQSGKDLNVVGIELRNTTQTLSIALVNLLSDEAATQDIQVTLQVNQNLVTAYNAANTGTLELLPQSAYAIQSLTVLIPKGSRTGTLSLAIPDASKLDAAKRFGIGFTIAAVSSGDVRIADNMKNVLFALTIKNDFEADYEISVDLSGHPSASGHYEETGTFGTVDASTVDAPLGVAGIFAAASRLSIKVNSDNSLTLTSNAATISQPVAGANYYDPATKTFHFDYTWGAGPRHIVGTARRL